MPGACDGFNFLTSAVDYLWSHCTSWRDSRSSLAGLEWMYDASGSTRNAGAGSGHIVFWGDGVT